MKINIHFSPARDSILGLQVDTAPGWRKGEYVAIGDDDGLLIDSISYHIELPSPFDRHSHITQNVMLVDEETPNE
jgi:hypothetical protein